MLGRTHALTGVFIGVLLVFFFSYSSIMLSAGIIFFSLFGSLFPDIDSSTSYVGRRAKIVGLFSKHRGFFHSVFPLIIVYILLLSFVNKWLAISFALGFISHILLDMLTKKGIRLYPFKKKICGPIRVGSFAETLFFIVQLFFIIYFTVKVV
ncbi:MAG: metal-dependent hydrolase [Candidatus Nanoarchaeia archaeon]